MENLVGQYYIENEEIISISAFPETDTENIIIYEIIRLTNKVPLFFEEHYNRLINSVYLAKFDISNLPSKDVVNTALQQLINKNSIDIGNIKLGLMFTKTGEYISLKMYFIPHHYPTLEDYENGVKLASHSAIRKQPNIKIRNRSLRNKANELIKTNSVFEILLINENDLVTEGSRSNIFFVKNDNIYTAKSSDILKGITWQYVIRICNELGIKVFQQDIKLSEISEFESCFITGTSPKIMPVNEIDDVKFLVKNYITYQILDKYEQLIISKAR